MDLKLIVHIDDHKFWFKLGTCQQLGILHDNKKELNWTREEIIFSNIKNVSRRVSPFCCLNRHCLCWGDNCPSIYVRIMSHLENLLSNLYIINSRNVWHFNTNVLAHFSLSRYYTVARIDTVDYCSFTDIQTEVMRKEFFFILENTSRLKSKTNTEHQRPW